MMVCLGQTIDDTATKGYTNVAQAGQKAIFAISAAAQTVETEIAAIRKDVATKVVTASYATIHGTGKVIDAIGKGVSLLGAGIGIGINAIGQGVQKTGDLLQNLGKDDGKTAGEMDNPEQDSIEQE